MTDPMTVAGTTVGVISLGIQVTQSLVKFYKSYRDQNADLIRLTTRLDGLLDTFQCLSKAVSDRRFQADELSIIETIETSIKECEELIHELRDECQKFNKTSKGITAAVKFAGRRATYPFRQSTLQKLDEDIGEIRANLSSALDVLQLRDSKKTQDDVNDNKVLLNLIRTSQISSNLREWLNAPDAFIDHHAACVKKHPGTGAWLVNNEQFSRWLTEKNSILWLNGFAGSGKSVLCSIAIQSALQHRRSDRSIGIAFFYFTFNDKSKQDESAMLRALLLQLSCQLEDGDPDLTQLHDRYKPGIPPPSVLIDYLHRLIRRFREVYILLDALDESPPNAQREDVLDALRAMQNWHAKCLHLFVTSRDESDIRESLCLSPGYEVKMQNADLDKDISDFISGRLDTDVRLQKLLPFREKIQESLASRAKGMFRWVDCQFEALRSCPCSAYHVELMLNSLPESLDETYERMLCSINYNLFEDARRIFTLLCYAQRPLTLQELIDGIAVEINDPTGLDRRRRLQDPSDIREICGSLIDIGPTVRISHVSVQEYLESKRILGRKAAKFSLSSVTAHTEIAEVCLIYLLDRDLPGSMANPKFLMEYPLAPYAATNWLHHYQYMQNTVTKLEDHILRFFQCQDSFVTWINLYNRDHSWDHFIRLIRPRQAIPNPIYHASLLGLHRVLYQLLDSKPLKSIMTSDQSFASKPKVSEQINAEGGFYGNALQAASTKGHVKVVQMLLKEGADIHAQGGAYYSALGAASYGGHIQVVQMLLANGAKVNDQNGGRGTALQAASRRGHEQVVRILLDKGADVNAGNKARVTPLQATSSEGHYPVLEMLRDNDRGTALELASNNGHHQVIKLLLERGANVGYGGALHRASCFKYTESLQTLLDNKFNANPKDGCFGKALKVASYIGHHKVVQILLYQCPNFTTEELRSALLYAKTISHDPIVQLLQNHEAVLHRKPTATEPV